MPKVLTITFSPVIDKSSSVTSLVPDKKLHCMAPKLEPGGGGINVARAILKLGGEAIALYPEGSYAGKFFSELLQKEKVPAITVPALHPTRENLVILETSSGKQFRFGMPPPPLLENEWKEILEKITAVKDIDYIVASGSVPEGVPDHIFALLADIAAAKNAKLVIDASGPALKAALGEGVYLAKPNLGELAALTGRENLTEAEVLEISRDLIQKGSCETLVVSMGAGGAMITNSKHSFRGIAPLVKSVSTVGAGDSMVAGIVFALSNNKSLQEALAEGIACGTAATLRPGTDLCRKEDVERLVKDVLILPMK